MSGIFNIILIPMPMVTVFCHSAYGYEIKIKFRLELKWRRAYIMKKVNNKLPLNILWTNFHIL